jgi:hypothetical protein
LIFLLWTGSRPLRSFLVLQLSSFGH